MMAKVVVVASTKRLVSVRAMKTPGSVAFVVHMKMKPLAARMMSTTPMRMKPSQWRNFIQYPLKCLRKSFWIQGMVLQRTGKIEENSYIGSVLRVAGGGFVLGIDFVSY